MPTHTFTFEYITIEQRLALEQTLAYLSHLNQTALTAVPGTVLDTCERIVLDQGRDALQTRADAVDAAQKKWPGVGPRGAARGRS
jgi:hypothetical protein